MLYRLLFIFTCVSNAFAGGPDLNILKIETDSSNVVYQVEEAVSDKQKMLGLMFRKHMPENQGMVFYNENPRPMSMWMKNTYISLDMLFADKDGNIVCIFENTEPFSTEILTCDKPVVLTLELNAGQVKEHDIKEGDKMYHHLLLSTKTGENK